MAETTTLPRVDVIIAVRNEPRLTTCLAALERQTYPRHLITVVVVNNGAPGTLPAGVETDPRYLVLHEPVPGAGAARNKGVAHTSGEVIAITDGDCHPVPQWIEAGVAALMAGEPMVAGAIQFTFAADRPTVVEYADARFHLQQQRYARAGYAATTSAFYRREAFEAVGGFDPAFLAVEDVDLGLRISKGAPIKFVPEALVLHPARQSLRDLLHKRVVQARYVHRSVPWTWRKILKRTAPRPWHMHVEALRDPTLPRLTQRLAHAAILQALTSVGGVVGARERLLHGRQQASARRASRDNLSRTGTTTASR